VTISAKLKDPTGNGGLRPEPPASTEFSQPTLVTRAAPKQ
jgi:hypothetical protein